jgi:hypothetical protein
MSKSLNVSIAADIEPEVAEALELLEQTYPDLSQSGRVCLALIEWAEMTADLKAQKAALKEWVDKG